MRTHLSSVLRELRCLAALVALLALAPASLASEGVNVDLGTTFGVPVATYAGASGQPGTWTQAGLGGTALADLTGAPSAMSVNVGASSTGNAAGLAVNDDELLLKDNVFSSGTWTLDFSGLDDGDYTVFLYAASHTSIPTGSMTVGGVAVANIPGDAGSALIEGTSWASAEVTVAGGTLSISASGITGTALVGLAGIQLQPLAPGGVNVDFGQFPWAEPADTYGAAAGQAGTWNPAILGANSLTDLLGYSSSMTVNVTSAFVGNLPGGSGDAWFLFQDYFFDDGTWSVDFAGLEDGSYLAYLYAPSNNIVPTGSMTVGGTAVASIPGDATFALIEGTSWVSVEVAVTGGALAISGVGVNLSGLAGIQLVQIPTPEPVGVNIDFGLTYGVPASTYGAAGGMPGTWNQAGLGATALVDLTGAATVMGVNVAASSTGNSVIPANDDGVLLNDDVFSSGAWSIDVTGLASGTYDVFLYASSNPSVSTSNMTVGGLPVASLPGDPGSSLIEGTSWAQLEVAIAGGTLSITGGGGFSGLAGLQIKSAVGAPPVTYCTAGTSASGCMAVLSSAGASSASASSGFDLIATGVEEAKDGLFFFGANGRQANPWGSGTSLQCVAPPVKRAGLLMGSGTVGGCNGSFTQDLNARWTAKPAQNPGAGAVVQAQLWYRDPFNTSNQTTSLSDAIEFTVGP